MSSAIEGLEPRHLWKHFSAITRIPHGSKNEAALAQFVLDTAQQLGLEGRRDGYGNVVVRKPASPGREGRPGVCLQTHLDMVCEKNADRAYDFTKDPIQLARRGEVIAAEGTSLGADNGIGIAASLAVMEDRSLAHGPLEMLFTVEEEIGLVGAQHLEPGFIRSPILLNLDSEDEGEIYVGCSGGQDTVGSWPVSFEEAKPNMVALEVRVTGLKGGHSGLEIDKGRGNALKILNRVILTLTEDAGARLARIDGGSKRNAIPREAFAVVFVPKSRLKRAKRLVAEWEATARAEVPAVEPELKVTATESQAAGRQVLKRKHQRQVGQALSALPHGVLKMSAEIPSLVETSTNLAVLQTTPELVTLGTSQRSSVKSEIREAAQTVRTILELTGARVEQGSGYPGWKPNLDSPILKLAQATYESLYGKKPEIKAVHAGLECGLIGEKYPGTDMISFGPTMRDVHSPDERVYVDTVPKFWSFLVALLDRVA